jgi:hypothetical protein
MNERLFTGPAKDMGGCHLPNGKSRIRWPRQLRGVESELQDLLILQIVKDSTHYEVQVERNKS